MITVVIPTLNVAGPLKKLLACLNGARGDETVSQIIVADGGSSDDTLAIAEDAGVEIVIGVSGRGRQLAQGARAARGQWLLFLHADSLPCAGWQAPVRAFIGECQTRGHDQAAYFRLRFDDDSRQARRLARVVAWRCRVFALAYGDQGLLISARHFRAIGGFKDIPLMEDVDIVRRIGRHRLKGLDHDMITSAERYRKHGFVRRSGRNLVCLTAYFCGVPPSWIARIYS